MIIILDTHVLLWVLAGERDRFSDSAYDLLMNPRNTVLMSVVSAWEVEIKLALGKLDVPSSFYDEASRMGFDWLPVILPHVQQMRSLQSFHNDPFDRLLIAQAQHEKALVMTEDSNIKRYEVSTLPCNTRHRFP